MSFGVFVFFVYVSNIARKHRAVLLTMHTNAACCMPICISDLYTGLITKRNFEFEIKVP